ncbi:SMI1/KNR4 family protein [Capnocytophaga gingivalis]|uniref:SMI1/KNR4 family protein n=1 Tax=Capnocytophaga gingivalis TaxID=1017 RepID=UPI0028E79E1E|nr:SMI1/KNR4 family protein [Capnocytophaga gingivalis]
MANILLQQLENALPEGMQIPEELRQLYQWIEDNGYYSENEGIRYGYLYPQDKLRESWKEEEREGGTDIAFSVLKNIDREEVLENYYKKHKDEVRRRLLVFAQSGADGSECALWLDDEGHTQIVHIGSGSGSMMTCILVKNALDFLRLLAIGYDEICWDEEYSSPPNSNKDNTFVHPNTQYQEWVQNTFHTTIPKIGLEVATPHSMDDEPVTDLFLKWFLEMTE